MADSTSLVLYDRRTADPEVIALAGFLAGYGGRTREAYALDLRQFFAWCSDRQLRLFDAHRTDIELYASELEERGWRTDRGYADWYGRVAPRRWLGAAAKRALDMTVKEMTLTVR